MENKSKTVCIMTDFKKMSSLVEMASCQVAINLCQDNDFKEVAMCLEKPTYGVSIWSSPDIRNIHKVPEWDKALNKECERLMVRLPKLLKQRVCMWMNRIALIYSSYCRRQEFLFGVSRYFLMDILAREDWTSDCKLNEKRLAKRLLQDERLSILQRYRIACHYCLHINIPYLWYQLSSEEQLSINGSNHTNFSQEKDALALLWSYYMDGRRDEITSEKNGIWKYAAVQAVRNGNWSAMMQCWKRLNKYARKDIREIILKRALQSLKGWKSVHSRDKWRENLVSNLPHEEFKSVHNFNLPSYYCELLHFFLSKMCKTQQLGFFQIAFEHWGVYVNTSGISILECFLEWPLRDYFLPLINRFWTTIPKFEYGEFLLIVASIYNGSYQEDSTAPKEEDYYDYRSLLFNLWENAPEDFRQFCNEYNTNRFRYETTIANCLLVELSKKYGFIENDYTLFKRVFRDVPQKNRTELILCSRPGICRHLIHNENSKPFEFVDWLLEQCLPQTEICSFRKQLIESCTLRCFLHLLFNNEKYLKDFIDWGFTLDTDKIEVKRMLINYDGVSHWVSSVIDGNFNKVERAVNFCLSGDIKVQFKENVVFESCRSLLKNCAWQQMDRCLAWGIDSLEKIIHIKQNILCSYGFDVHHDLVFVKRHWESVKYFYKWFGLSPEEIMELKKSTVFSAIVTEDVHSALYGDGDIEALVESLQWCLTDERMLINFKEEIEKQYFQKQELQKKLTEARQRLDDLMNSLLHSFKRTIRKNKSGEESLMRNKQKNSLVTEDESISQKKRLKRIL